MPHRLVVNIRNSSYDVRVDRTTELGNPFRIGEHGTRDQVIAKYKEWVVKQPLLMARIRGLRGMVLGCWCAPRNCHADIIAELANGENNDGQVRS